MWNCFNIGLPVWISETGTNRHETIKYKETHNETGKTRIDFQAIQVLSQMLLLRTK